MFNLSTVLNPWRELRHARAACEWLRAELDRERAATARLAERVSEANNRADQHSLTALARANELTRLHMLLRNAHFRNPKTGRLGRRGERFE